MTTNRFRFPVRRGRPAKQADRKDIPLLKTPFKRVPLPSAAISSKTTSDHPIQCGRLVSAKPCLNLFEYLELQGDLTFQQRSALEGYHQWMALCRQDIMPPKLSQWRYNPLRMAARNRGIVDPQRDINQPKITHIKTLLKTIFDSGNPQLVDARQRLDNLIHHHLFDIKILNRITPEEKAALLHDLHLIAQKILTAYVKK